MKNKGFTLIELLVVIAIIGILSSVVLASLNTARSKGSDAAIKEDLNNIRAQTELFYDGTVGNQTYTNVCADANVKQGVLAALAAGVGSQTAVGIYCSSDATHWAAFAPLKTTTSSSWCVDYTGQSKLEATSPTAAITACP
jgi:prepilin-type N-terminal cleavage/methylation domain-containing protein